MQPEGFKTLTGETVSYFEFPSLEKSPKGRKRWLPGFIETKESILRSLNAI